MRAVRTSTMLTSRVTVLIVRRVVADVPAFRASSGVSFPPRPSRPDETDAVKRARLFYQSRYEGSNPYGSVTELPYLCS